MIKTNQSIMASDLPNQFDVIVLGSGMPESIVAAAFSRIGQAVLHIDRSIKFLSVIHIESHLMNDDQYVTQHTAQSFNRERQGIETIVDKLKEQVIVTSPVLNVFTVNEYYSGDWASFNLQGIESWTKQHEELSDSACGIQRPSIDETNLLEAEESLIQLPLVSSNFSEINLEFLVEEGEDDTNQSDNAEVERNMGSELLKSESTSTDESNNAELNPEQVTELMVSEVPENLIKTETIENNASDGQDGLLNNDTEKAKANGEEVEVIQNANDMEEGSDRQMDQKTGCDETTCKKTDKDSDKETVTDSEKTGSENERSQVPANAIQSIDTKVAENQPKKWTTKRLKAEWRKFNLDISPKVIYSGGDMVELLISSDIAKYCEFKTVTRILTLLNGDLEKVPCSRADVFSSKKVSMIEKRMLMKFLQFCLDFENKTEEIGDFLQRPFREFLDHKKLTENVKHYIQHSIAMATDSTTTEQGLQQMRKFLKSVGRYGNTAFLWSLYGSGELPQSFCRMCAVFGGLYCLRMSASSIIVNKDNRCTGIITTEGQRISCKWLIMENSYTPANFIVNESKSILSRAIIMTDKPLLPTDQQEISLMCLPCPDDGNRPVMVLELPPSSLACPRGTYIFHLTRKGCVGGKPEDDLTYAVDKLFRTEVDSTEDSDQANDKPTILWSLYFSQCDMSTVHPTEHVPVNVILTSGPGSEIDIDRPVKEAKDVFKKILPDEEFLPKAPNPEDIIYVDDAEAQVAEDSSQSEFKETEDVQSDTVDKSASGKEAEVLAKVSTDNAETNSKETDSTNKTVDDKECAEL